MFEDLKHSIRTHLAIMQGPTPQLAVFLIKLVDFLEDKDEARLSQEADILSFALVESIAIHVQSAIDHKAEKERSQNRQLPEHIKSRGDQLLVMVGKSRGLPDKRAAKHALLCEVASALRSLSTYTKSSYPTITDVSGNPL